MQVKQTYSKTNEKNGILDFMKIIEQCLMTICND